MSSVFNTMDTTLVGMPHCIYARRLLNSLDGRFPNDSFQKLSEWLWARAKELDGTTGYEGLSPENARLVEATFRESNERLRYNYGIDLIRYGGVLKGLQWRDMTFNAIENDKAAARISDEALCFVSGLH